VNISSPAPSGPLVLLAPMLEDARAFFEERGTYGFEGTALIKSGTQVELVVPTQHASRDGRGRVNVEVRREGQMELARALGAGELYVARIHSHPCDAFHSEADDANPVMPFFGLALRRGLDACAVYRYQAGRWVELAVGAERDRWVLTEGTS